VNFGELGLLSEQGFLKKFITYMAITVRLYGRAKTV